MNKICCNICNKVYSSKYMTQHTKTLFIYITHMNIMLKKKLKKNLKIILFKLTYKIIKK